MKKYGGRRQDFNSIFNIMIQISYLDLKQTSSKADTKLN